MFKHHNSQHSQFAYRAIPILFHNQTKDFIDFLEKDGIKFLKFWWDHAGNEVDDDCQSSMKGLSFQIREYVDGRKIVLIIMPPPQKASEAFMLALVSRPLKKSFLPWKNFSHVYVLSLVGESGDEPQTQLGEITPRRVVNVPIGRGPQPEVEAFYEAVCKELKKAK